MRLTDPHDGLISLTNLAMFVVVLKLARTPNWTPVELGAFVGALGAYHAKKVVNRPSPMSPAPAASQGSSTGEAGASPLSAVGVGGLS